MNIFKPHEAINIIKQFLPENPVVVEAGAFDGTDTKKMAHTWPNGTIHAFEPVPELFEKLTKNTKEFKNVHRYQLALSDFNGTQTFYVSEKPSKPGIPSQAGSLRKPKERLKHSPLIFPKTIQVPTITLETWAHQYGIDHNIDLLWLDTQGHELSILQAADTILENVKVIYTEVAFIQAYEGQSTHEDVINWITQHGFEYVGHDFKDTTSWFFGNVLFVRKT